MSLDKAKTINILTWNVNGLRSRKKVARVSEFCKDSEAQIILLQETHLERIECKQCFTKYRWVQEVVCSDQSGSTRGVAIIVKTNHEIRLLKYESDFSGRWLVATFLVYGRPLVCAVYYGPNNDIPDSLEKLESCLLKTTAPIVLGGDFNLVLNKVLDRTSKAKYNSPPKTLSRLMSMMREFNLVDIWRTMKKEFTFYSKKYRHHSRMDYFLVDQEIRGEVTHIPAIISDHSAVMLALRYHQIEEGRRWTLDRVILLDERIVEDLREKSESFFITNNGSAEEDIVWDAFKCYLRGILKSSMVAKYRADKQDRESAIQAIKNKEGELQKASMENPDRLDALSEELEGLQAAFRAKIDKKIIG